MRPSGKDLIRFLTTPATVLHILVLGYAAFVILCSFAAPVGKFDDSIPLVHAMLIDRGYTPNLDFFSFYPPLNLYLSAAAFRLIGQTVFATRIIAAALYVALLIVVVWFFHSRFRAWGALVPVAVGVVAAAIGQFVTFPAWPGVALSVIALLTYLSAQNVERHRLWWVALSGVMAALAVLTRINFGGYAVAAIGCDFLQRWWLDGHKRRVLRVKNELATLAAFALPFVIFSVGFCLWVYGRNIDVGLSDFIVTTNRLMKLRGFIDYGFTTELASVVVFPSFWFFFRILNGSSGFPIRAVIPAVFGGVLLVAALGNSGRFTEVVILLELAAVAFMHLFIYRLQPSEFSLLVFFTCFLHYYISRADPAHWIVFPIAAALLTPFLFSSRYDPGKSQFVPLAAAKGTAVAVMSAMIFVCFTSFAPPFRSLRDGVELVRDFIQHPGLSDSERILGGAPFAGAWYRVYHDQEEMTALKYLRTHSGESAPLFVGVSDHSRIFWTDLRMYWLAGLPIGVRTFQLEGSNATEPVHRAVIDDLERNKATRIILDCEIVGDAAFFNANYHGSELLDDYLRKHFRHEASFGPYVVLVR